MSELDLRECLDFASDAAQRGGRITLEYFQKNLDVKFKSDRSPVTAADLGAERTLRALIQARYPKHGILGEEGGYLEGNAPYLWILDPIDGTQSFIRGVPLYGVLVGLEFHPGGPHDPEGCRTLLGVAHFPALGETVAAARGLGCTWNNQPARVSAVDRLERATLVYSAAKLFGDAGGQEALQRLTALVRVDRGWGDCYGHILVATGRADLMVDPVLNVWDCAAIQPIVEEAGGSFTDFRGVPTIRGGNGISTNRLLHDELCSVLGPPRDLPGSSS